MQPTNQMWITVKIHYYLCLCFKSRVLEKFTWLFSSILMLSSFQDVFLDSKKACTVLSALNTSSLKKHAHLIYVLQHAIEY